MAAEHHDGSAQIFNHEYPAGPAIEISASTSPCEVRENTICHILLATPSNAKVLSR